MPRLNGPLDKIGQNCGTCNQVCLTGTGRVFCDACEKWYHATCEQMTIPELREYSSLPLDFPYICTGCRTSEKGTFDFQRALKRLHKAAKQGYHKLQSCVHREKLFVKDKFTCAEEDSEKHLLIRSVPSEHLLDTTRDSNRLQAIQTGMDGNSLFSAVSIAVTFHDKFATELRVRCCLEMVSHAPFYQWQQDSDLLCHYAPDYVDSCLACATPNEDSCVFTLSALASVIQRPIVSLYPSVDKLQDETTVVLNRTFMPREEAQIQEPIRIMWSSSQTIHQSKPWVPEYFVPLIRTDLKKVRVVVSGLSCRSDCNKRKAINENDFTPEDSADVTNKTDSYYNDDGDKDVSEVSKFQLRSKKKRMLTNLKWPSKYTYNTAGGKPLEDGVFLTGNEVFKELTTYESVLPSIPKGHKENVFFIVDNSQIVCVPGKKKSYPNDCSMYGAKKGTSYKAWFRITENGILESLKKVGGKFCREKTFGGKGSYQKQRGYMWIPLEPQPKNEELVLVHRYYSFPLCDPSYRRRISWFASLPPSVTKGREVFLVEYSRKPKIACSQQSLQCKE